MMLRRDIINYRTFHDFLMIPFIVGWGTMNTQRQRRGNECFDCEHFKTSH